MSIIDKYNLFLLENMNIKNKILYFIHIPKTSGTALDSKQIIKQSHKFHLPKIYRTPKNLNGHHFYDTEYWETGKYPIKNHIKISIIRNPYDLLCSYYFHNENLNLNSNIKNNGWASVNYTHKFKSFKQFINAYCDPKFDWHIPIFKNFLFSQLFNTQHDCIANIIIKYEYLDEAKKILNRFLEHKIKQTLTNKSILKKKNYKDYYDKEMIEKVRKKCARELKYYNYDFNGSTKKEVFIINSDIKYDFINDKVYKSYNFYYFILFLVIVLICIYYFTKK